MRFNNKNGEFIVHIGTMFGGKSSALISDVNKCRIAGLKVFVFKPIIDERYDKTNIMSHDGDGISAKRIKKLSEVKQYLDKFNYEAVAIDEFQFVDIDIDFKDFIINDILLKGKKLIISGLEIDSDLNTFDNIKEVLPYASTIEQHKPICVDCLEPAYTIFCKVKKDGQVLVGGKDLYDPVCLSCYNKRLNGEETNN